MKLCNISSKDLDEIVKIHEASFPNFFLTNLGSKFLLAYYSKLIRDFNDSCFYVEFDGCIAGFAICTTSIKNNKFDFNFYFNIFLIIIKNFLRVTFIINLIFKIISKIKLKISGKYIYIESIATDPRFRKLGIGNQLIQSIKNYGKKINYDYIYLTTDFDNNLNTLSFYESNGFYVIKIFKQSAKRTMLLLRCDLSK